MIDPSRCLLGSLLLSVSLTAQVPLRPELGPFSTTGLGFVKAVAGNDLVQYRADRQQTEAFPPIGNGVPEFTRDRIFHQLSLQQRQAVQIDAISTGCDVIPVVKHQPSGRFRITQLGPLGWSALFFSVAGSSVGSGATGPVAVRAAAGGAGADLYSWITPGSNVLGGLESRVFLDVPSDRLGVPQSQEITAIDIPMALMAQSQSSHVNIFAEHEHDFFFSLTKQSVQMLVTALGGPLPNVAIADMSGATVFMVHWDGFNWSNISVAVHPSELGLAGSDLISAVDDEELDALALTAHSSSAVVQVVFSVQLPTQKPQLNYYRGGSSPNSGLGELFDQNGNSIPNQLGGSDIDAVCGVDPEFITQLSPWLGTPYSGTVDPPLILSATHMWPETGGALQLVVDVNGPKSMGTKLDVELYGTMCVYYNCPSLSSQWVPWGNQVQWSGYGSRRLIGPTPLPVGGPVQFCAVLQTSTGALQLSTTVFTSL